jgi:hypothetical protein
MCLPMMDFNSVYNYIYSVKFYKLSCIQYIVLSLSWLRYLCHERLLPGRNDKEGFYGCISIWCTCKVQSEAMSM